MGLPYVLCLNFTAHCLVFLWELVCEEVVFASFAVYRDLCLLFVPFQFKCVTLCIILVHFILLSLSLSFYKADEFLMKNRKGD